MVFSLKGAYMKNLQTFVIALPLLIVSSLASAVSVSGNIALTSDYIWRGMTQSAGGPAVAGGFDLSTDSGFYIGTWGSSVQFSDGEAVDTTELELDVYLGYSTDIADNISLDVGYITYTYPGATDANFDEAYIGFDIYGFGISYAAGIDGAADYVSVGYGIDAGPGSFSIAYGDYEDTSNDFLIGYDWGVGGDFGIGVYYYDLEMDGGADDSGVTLTISYAP